MTQSLSQILVHIVFSTQKRIAWLDDKITGELYLYINKILQNQNCVMLQIGGTKDHIHILCAITKNLSISKIIEEVKISSSKWIKTKNEIYKGFYWQRGYGAFSISPSHKQIVCNYIANQKKHHQQVTFADELRKLLKKYNVNFEEQYLWD
jgi:putative transposase